MRLILVRHAEAVHVGEAGVTADFDRHLTAAGHDTAAKLAASLRARGVSADAILSSPLVRAKQTAEPLRQLVRGNSNEPGLSDALAPDSHDPAAVARLVEKLNAATVVLVGHLPDIASLTSWLIGAGGRGIDFGKGSAASLFAHGPLIEGSATLEWLVTPAWYGADLAGE